ncbi:MAG: TolB family protein, partial [Vicinamibacterales bacterium]
AMAVPRRSSQRLWMAVVALALLALVLGGVAVTLYLRRVSQTVSATRLSLSAPGQIIVQSAPAVAPDGRRVAFVATGAAGRPMLWIRELNSLEPRLLAGTEDAVHPFWSPDGRSIGFVAVRTLKRVDATGGRGHHAG